MKLPKLHLRDLFWLVLACALAIGWMVERTNLKGENVQLREMFSSLQTANQELTHARDLAEQRVDNLIREVGKEGYGVEMHAAHVSLLPP